MNVGKVREVETIKGYKINRKAIGCKFHPWCYDCPFPDCIRGQNYDDTMTEHGKKLTEKEREIRIKQAITIGGFGDHFAEACKKYQGKEKEE